MQVSISSSIHAPLADPRVGGGAEQCTSYGDMPPKRAYSVAYATLHEIVHLQETAWLSNDNDADM